MNSVTVSRTIDAPLETVRESMDRIGPFIKASGADEGTEVTATTTFELGVPLVGDALDSTVIERQRRSELAAQFDWLARVC